MKEGEPQSQEDQEGSNKKFRDEVKEDLNFIYKMYQKTDRKNMTKFISHRNYLFNDLLDKVERNNIIAALENIKSEDRESFVGKALKIIEPVFRFSEEEIDRSNDRLKKKSAEAVHYSFTQGNFEKINDALLYNYDTPNSISIHLAPIFKHERPTYRRSIQEYGKIFEDGLRELAVLVDQDKNIKEITATSHIVTKNPKLVAKMGFTVSDESFEGRGRKWTKAFISREDFLKKYLKKEK